MAIELKPGGYYIFDKQQPQAAVISREESPSLARRLKLFFRSRFSLLTAVFLMAGSLIFYSTAALQINPYSASGISETTGVARQLTIHASRGDIVDAAGIPLAYSKTVNTLLVSYAGLSSGNLNAMLLDLSLFLEEQGVAWHSELSDYFVLSHESCGHTEGEGEDCGVPVFLKGSEEIAYWQSDSQLFNLQHLKDGDEADYANSLIKSDPLVFFNYLLYTKYAIEDPEADGQLYSRSEAFRIMQLRYLIMVDSWAFLNGIPLEIARDISPEVVARVNEQNYRFMGVITSQDTVRAYTRDSSSLCHVLGYVMPITSTQYKELRTQGYRIDAIFGQAGVESTAERYLAGQDGIKAYNIWTVAGEDGEFFSENIGKDPVPGYNVRLTLNLDLQQIAERSLNRVIEEIRNSADNKNKGDADAGAVVMIDVRTGEILAMVSSPGYDPNDFMIRDSDEEAAERVAAYLTDNVSKPMLNRAIMENYAPGSTFKPATAVAALESGAVTATSNTIRCKGSEIIGEWLWHCLEKPYGGHGNLTLVRALATSCNMYFYNLGYRTGINQIDYWGQKLGLGEYTGIDLPGEAKGIRASRTTKKLLRSEISDQIWFPADTCQTAIGQFDNSFTVLQLAIYAAALATGNKVTPHVIKEIYSNDGVIIKKSEYTPAMIGLQESTLKIIRQGMIAVANNREGTAYNYFRDFPIMVAAKTGTAETGYEDVSSSNGLFICYAPADDPQVAIAQIVEKGAWGSNTIAIAKDLLTAYFGLDEGYGAEDAAVQPGIEDDQLISPPTETQEDE